MARRALPPSVVSPPLFRLEPNPLLFVGVAHVRVPVCSFVYIHGLPLIVLTN